MHKRVIQMKILVTGGTGSIGQEICRNLTLSGHKPVCFARKDRGVYPVIIGDVNSKTDIQNAISAGFDYIIHAAAAKRNKCKREIISTNINGTINIIDSCNNLPIKIISSVEAFNANIECYGASKFIIEELSKDYPNISFIRLPTVWGSDDTLATHWLQSAKDTGKISLFKFNQITKKKFFVTLKDAGKLCCEFENQEIIKKKIRVIDCSVLATAVQQLTSCAIEIIETQGNPYEYFSKTICSKDVESISVEEAKNIIKEIYLCK